MKWMKPVLSASKVAPLSADHCMALGITVACSTAVASSSELDVTHVV